ncbi:hypothetical protein EC973_007302 [Apophysomyces ossiformis]|uniref:Inhibitor of growth protein N-terminal histone-binding domain-containing protein n=1 Tax=Apophysomyces ossiformis TaxID=679940 RepID=A0A8H7BPY6_9FUNG|nr:hypothetical protein EC973_007302 [Apophysomyces ossiformis]
MHELRSMDEDFQRLRELYTKHRRTYAKLLRSSTASSPSTPTSATPPPVNHVAARLQLEKDHKAAVQKQDQKIELALRMYDLVSRHIERIDSQMAASGIAEGDWIGQRVTNGNRRSPSAPWEDSWREGMCKNQLRMPTHVGG